MCGGTFSLTCTDVRARRIPAALPPPVARTFRIDANPLELHNIPLAWPLDASGFDQGQRIATPRAYRHITHSLDARPKLGAREASTHHFDRRSVARSTVQALCKEAAVDTNAFLTDYGRPRASPGLA